jgi:hypothetical protein
MNRRHYFKSAVQEMADSLRGKLILPGEWWFSRRHLPPQVQ